MIDLTKPTNLASEAFVNNKYEWYERIREEKPLHQVKISVVTMYAVSRFEDCEAVLKDPRILRNRSTVTGGGRAPFPMPKSISAMMESMIVEDDPNHRRLRELVRRAFLPQAIKKLEQNIDEHSHELLDELSRRRSFDLQSEYALPIPLRMIGDMLGVSREDMPIVAEKMAVITKGFEGLRMLRTLFWDLRGALKFVQWLVRQKQTEPGDDILTALINAEIDGDRLSEDELVAMVFLLMVGGFETTVHSITNGIHTLLSHPEQLEQLRAEPELIDLAVEEIMRHRGPIHGTKMGWAAQDIEIHGQTVPKGKPIFPLLAAANHDPRAFDDPQKFDITRSPNRHLAFGHGVHFCLGAHLARAETRLAILNLVQRVPNLKLENAAALKLKKMPAWHRYEGLPVTTG